MGDKTYEEKMFDKSIFVCRICKEEYYSWNLRQLQQRIKELEAENKGFLHPDTICQICGKKLWIVDHDLHTINCHGCLRLIADLKKTISNQTESYAKALNYNNELEQERDRLLKENDELRKENEKLRR